MGYHMPLPIPLHPIPLTHLPINRTVLLRDRNGRTDREVTFHERNSPIREVAGAGEWG